MHILDRDRAAEGNFWREATDVRVVTMAGWPSLVAYGPPINRHWKVGSGRDGTKSSDSTYMRVLGRAEVMVTWGPPVKPLKGQPCNWLGPCLRDEMSSRLEIKDREERAAIVGSGLAVGASLAMGWAFQQPWVIERVKELVGV